ncbi:MAG: hypothetical protein WBW16_05540 [Bacteroidota bacterium]
MRSTLLWCLALAVCVVLVGAPVMAQQPSEGPLWVMSFWKMKFESAPDWQRLVRASWLRDQAELKKAGLIEDYAVMTHDYGSEWNLLTMARFKDYAGVDVLEQKEDEVLRKTSPDTVASAALGKVFRSYLLEHYDSFVRPLAGTSLNPAAQPGSNPLWVFSFYQVKLGHLDEIENWIKNNWKRADERLKSEGVIQDYCYLRHDYGSEWNLIRVVRLNGYGDVDKFQKRAMEIAKESEPDEAKRTANARQFTDLVLTHYDSFMRQMTPK